MKLQEISIRETRGLRAFDRVLGCDNLVVYGENGTGKSGLVDAIDFLLTGAMRRISGAGTSGIDLNTHGKHVASKLEDSVVTAKVQIRSSTIDVKRTMKSKDLEILNAGAMDSAAFLDSIKAGHFALTRKELLKFIACEGSKRAEQVQSLLDLQDIDKIRTSFSQSLKALDKLKIKYESVCQSSERQIDSFLELKQGSWSDRLEKVNAARQQLGGDKIEELTDDTNILLKIDRTQSSVKIVKSTVTKLIENAEESKHNKIADIEEAKQTLATILSKSELSKLHLFS